MPDKRLPDKAIEAAAKVIFDSCVEKHDPPYIWETGKGILVDEDVKDTWREVARDALKAAEAHIIASYEEQPNVLSKEEARLLAMGFYGELDDAPGDMLIAAQAVADRLSEWSDLHSEGGEQ